MTNLVDIKKTIKSLSPSEGVSFLEALGHDVQSTMVEVEGQRFAEGVYCPHFGFTENLTFDNLSNRAALQLIEAYIKYKK